MSSPRRPCRNQPEARPRLLDRSARRGPEAKLAAASDGDRTSCPGAWPCGEPGGGAEARGGPRHSQEAGRVPAPRWAALAWFPGPTGSCEHVTLAAPPGPAVRPVCTRLSSGSRAQGARGPRKPLRNTGLTRGGAPHARGREAPSPAGRPPHRRGPARAFAAARPALSARRRRQSSRARASGRNRRGV